MLQELETYRPRAYLIGDPHGVFLAHHPAVWCARKRSGPCRISSSLCWSFSDWRTIRIADQYVRGVVFRLGRYHATKGPGVYWIIPLIEWQRRVDLRINTAAVEQQETITKDSVPIKVNAVVWYHIVNPMASVLEVRASTPP